MKECIFCKISNKEVPSKVISESDKSIAFLDVNPLSKGHTLVIPKSHSKTLLDLESDGWCDMNALVKKVVSIIQDKLNPDGFNIGLNMNIAGGQAVDHIHIHIIPRWTGDGGGSIHTIINNPPEEALESVYKQLSE